MSGLFRSCFGEVAEVAEKRNRVKKVPMIMQMEDGTYTERIQKNGVFTELVARQKLS